jgi:hypothetical protein
MGIAACDDGGNGAQPRCSVVQCPTGYVPGSWIVGVGFANNDRVAHRTQPGIDDCIPCGTG